MPQRNNNKLGTINRKNKTSLMDKKACKILLVILIIITNAAIINHLNIMSNLSKIHPGLRSIINTPVMIKKQKGEEWEIWNHTDPLFQYEPFAKCAWSNFTPTFFPEFLNATNTINMTEASGYQMCLHPEYDIVSHHIRETKHWFECDMLSSMWYDYLRTTSDDATSDASYHFEIGANIGACVMQILLTTPSNIHVVAFEPNPRNLFCLTSTLGRLPYHIQHRVTVFPVALGATMAKSTLHMEVGNFGNSIVSKGGISENPSLNFLEPIEIHVEVLDELLDFNAAFKVGVMKMDIQGFECFAMSGMHNVLKRTQQIKYEVIDIFLEAFDNCSSQILLMKMQESGFDVLDLKHNPVSMDGKPPNGDYLSVKTRKSL